MKQILKRMDTFLTKYRFIILIFLILFLAIALLVSGNVKGNNLSKNFYYDNVNDELDKATVLSQLNFSQLFFERWLKLHNLESLPANFDHLTPDPVANEAIITQYNLDPNLARGYVNLINDNLNNPIRLITETRANNLQIFNAVLGVIASLSGLVFVYTTVKKVFQLRA